ncbi:MAG: crotonase/enoyl-CoA hydratase family protein, partial [Caldilineaceae bacterium]|nr:crotonase/enoyl-CoA hydratase family protein [Caldilineaceae bacterium]
MSSFGHLNLPDSLHVQQDGEILHVQLARPQKRNALNDETLLGLEQIFTHVPSEVRVAILASQGDHFCAGLDLSELAEHDAVEGIYHSRTWHRVFACIQFGAVPVVAVLRGAVIGGGLELACAAHVRVAETSTFYALPESQHGIFPGGGASVQVPKLIGLSRTMEMMLTGRRVSAEEGATWGFAHYLVEEGAGLDKALELARTIAGNTPFTNYAILQV